MKLKYVFLFVAICTKLFAGYKIPHTNYSIGEPITAIGGWLLQASCINKINDSNHMFGCYTNEQNHLSGMPNPNNPGLKIHFFAEHTHRLSLLPNGYNWELITNLDEIIGWKRTENVTSYVKWKEGKEIHLVQIKGHFCLIDKNDRDQFVISRVEVDPEKKSIKAWLVDSNQTIELPGLVGNTGLVSDKIRPYCINNLGDIVGSCNLYNLDEKTQEVKEKEVAVMWVNGQVIPLYEGKLMSQAHKINNKGQVIIKIGNCFYLLEPNGQRKSLPKKIQHVKKFTDSGLLLTSTTVYAAYSSTVIFDMESFNFFLSEINKSSNASSERIMSIHDINNAGTIAATRRTKQGTYGCLLFREN